MRKCKIILFGNTDWYLFNFRQSLAERLRAEGHDLLLISPPGPYGERLASLGYRWEALPMNRRSLNPLREMKLLRHLVGMFRSERPDIVHGFTIKAAVYGALAGKIAGVPAIVSSINGLGSVFIGNQMRARLLRPFVRQAMRLAFSGNRCRVIVQNPTDSNQLVAERIIADARIRRIPGSGVDCELFRPAEHETADERPLVALLPARLLWDKGIGEFVKASRILARKDICFRIAGEIDDGNPAAIDRAQADAWQQEGVVELLGHVEDMASALASSDIVVLPSYREGLPKSLIEAAACGKPIVTTDVPGCRDVVDDGQSGLIVPVRNAEALAGAIACLADDHKKRRDLGAAARSRAVREFDKEIIVRETIGVYQDVIR
jgi:glycosyltransferase involved in cell wall biosynthesis